jgi:hypothetical protein
LATLRNWSITLVTAAVTGAVLVTAVLLFVGTGTGSSAGPQSDADSAPAFTPLPPAAVGPEGVPLAKAIPLGPASPPRPGSARGGVPCGSGEQLSYHVHAHLTIYVNGEPRAVPLGVGIGAPRRITQNAGGPFVSGGGCFSYLHTHAADGIVHIEAPGPVRFSLAQFFAVWGQRLGRRHLGPATGQVIAYVDGRRWRGDPRAIPLVRHAQIQLEVGRPRVPPSSITFPKGL